MSDTQTWVRIGPDALGRTVRINVTSLAIPVAGGRLLYEHIPAFVEGQAMLSQQRIYATLCKFGRALIESGYKELLGGDRLWDRAIRDSYRYLMTTRRTDATLRTRVTSWNKVIEPFLLFLRQRLATFSHDVHLPRIPSSLMGTEERRVETLLELEPKAVPTSSKMDAKLVIGLGIRDSDFLRTYGEELARRRALLRDACLSWWDSIAAHYRFGQKIRHGRAVDALQELYDRGVRRRGIADGGGRGATHILNGSSPASLGLLLRIHEQKYGGLHLKVFLEKDKDLPSLSVIQLGSFVPAAPSPFVTKTTRLSWLLGNVGSRDIAVCCALLMMEHPNFTPWSLFNARLLDSTGARLIELGDGRGRIKVEKPRARAFKEAQLTELSFEILQTIELMTRNARSSLKACQSPASSALFLVSQPPPARLVNTRQAVTFLSGRTRGGDGVHERYFSDHFPNLHAAGLNRDACAVTFSKIRATEGVLEYLRSGSIVSTAKTLGNSRKVALRHYLPEALISALNARQIRRFQNLLIAVAWGDAPGLLALTDLNSIEELHAFIVDSLQEHRPSASPLAVELHRRFGITEKDGAAHATDDVLMVSVSSKSLALLYAYEAQVSSGGEFDEIRNVEYGAVTPRDMQQLAIFLRNHLVQHRDLRLREAHRDALELAPEIVRTGHIVRLAAREMVRGLDG